MIHVSVFLCLILGKLRGWSRLCTGTLPSQVNNRHVNHTSSARAFDWESYSLVHVDEKPRTNTSSHQCRWYFLLMKWFLALFIFSLSLNQWESLRISENSLYFSQYRTTEKNPWCYIDLNSANFHWFSETLTDSNLEWYEVRWKSCFCDCRSWGRSI